MGFTLSLYLFTSNAYAFSATILKQILNFATDRQVRQQLKEWQKALPSIQTVLADAEEMQMKDQNVKNWLAKLQNLGYDVGDIAEEFAFEAVHCKFARR
ncbi:hypothetical protein PTKIN_Ptkin14bG0198100 [Pterospermum kingtungense]